MPTESFSEEKVVESPIVQKLQDVGWRFIKADELQRESLEEPLLIADVIRSIKKLNPGVGIGDEEINKVLNELRLKSSTFDGIKQVLDYFKNGVYVKFEKDKVTRPVKLFDYKNIGNNDFVVTRQPWYQGKEKKRLDIVLYVNGIPLVNIECKDPTKPAESSYHAYRQIVDYWKVLPELYKYVQIGVGVCETAWYFPIVPWHDEAKRERWKSKSKDSIDSIIEMLKPDILMDLVKNFIFVREERGFSTKVIVRYMQYRAVNKIVDRVLDNMKNGSQPNKGLIWHWQGSGKTLEMIFAANKLFSHLGNPTIFVILDRRDLQKQFNEEYNALHISPLPERIKSKEDLLSILKHDEGSGKRGVFITLIQKFGQRIQDEIERLGDIPVKKRKDIIVFADEGHRTQYGSLASRMRDALRNSFYFAFTGTPLSKSGKDTYEVFSNPPEEKYLDKYFITDSIKDGFTVKIAYQPRLEDEKKVRLRKDMLKQFLEQEYDEIPELSRKDVEEKVRRRLNPINAWLKQPERIKLVAKDIASHFKENVDNKFRAMVVAADRETCVRYKKELDNLLPGHAEVVMTFNEKGDPRIIREYLEEMRERYGGKEKDEIIKEIIDKFKSDKAEEQPKIVIVTDMLLTGFDAPILQTMYLDKPLKEHRLLQAIARTNRPYKNVKEAGLIIDYVGVLKEFKRAFEIYSKDEINHAVYDTEELRDQFVVLLNEILDIFKGFSKKADREELLKAFEILSSDESVAKNFLRKYRKLRKLYELLGPDVIKARIARDFKWISAVFFYYRRIVDREKNPINWQVRKYFDRTLRYVYLATEIEKIKKNLPLIEFGEDYLKELEKKVKSREEKSADIVFTLNRYVLVDRHKNPVNESVADKVERIVTSWKEKTKDFEKIYAEGIRTLKEVLTLQERQKKLGFSNLEYSLLLSLEEELKSKIKPDDVKSLVSELNKHMFPNWSVQPGARKNVGKEIRRFLRKQGLGYEDRERLYTKLMNHAENYGKAN